MATKKKDTQQTLNPKFNVQLPVQVMFDERLDVYAKMVFAYMKFRYQFFSKYEKTTYHESITTIGKAVGIGRTKTIAVLKVLEDCGYITKLVRNADRKAPKTEQTNVYTVKDCLTGSKIENVVNKMQWEINELGDDPF